MNDTGRCANSQCTGAARLEPIERYPGAGQYCPDCGELLHPEAGTRSPIRGAWRDRRRRTILLACAVVIILAAAAAAVAAGTRSIAALGVRVCTSTMSNRLANEIVRDYSGRHGVWPFHYNVTPPGDLACDVRFSTALTSPNDSVIARDAVVAVVNPQNPIARLAISKLRDVLAGRIVDWSQLGGRPGAIVAVVPTNGSDEAAAVAARVMFGKPFGRHIIRGLTADAIARSVSSPSGARWIGIVPFSAALPAKVIALGNAPAPSLLSIALTKEGYDFWVAYVNAHRGLRVGKQAYRAEIRYADDASSPPLTAERLENLIAREHIDFILGPYGSGPTFTAAAVAERHQIPMVDSGGAAESIFNQGYRYTVNVMSPARKYLVGIIEYAVRRNPRPKTIAISAASDAFSLEVQQGAVQSANDHGIHVVYADRYTNDPASVAIAAAAIKAAAPDIVLNAGHLEDALLMQRALKEQHVPGTRARTIDRTAVRNALAHLDVVTFFGLLKFDSRGVNVFKPMVVDQIQRTKLVTIYPYRLANAVPVYPAPAWNY